MILYNDSVNWISYGLTEEGEIEITDFPNSGHHGGGQARTRRAHLEEEKRQAVVSHLNALNRNSNSIRENLSEMKFKLKFPYYYLNAIIEDNDASKVLKDAKRNYGWSFTPGAWGKDIEESFWKMAEILEK